MDRVYAENRPERFQCIITILLDAIYHIIADYNPLLQGMTLSVGAEKTVWNSFSRKPWMGEAYGHAEYCNPRLPDYKV